MPALADQARTSPSRVRADPVSLNRLNPRPLTLKPLSQAQAEAVAGALRHICRSVGGGPLSQGDLWCIGAGIQLRGGFCGHSEVSARRSIRVCQVGGSLRYFLLPPSLPRTKPYKALQASGRRVRVWGSGSSLRNRAPQSVCFFSAKQVPQLMACGGADFLYLPLSVL